MGIPLLIMAGLGTATVAMGAAAAAMIWIDKRRAGSGGRRIPERTLHAAELAGGWLGSWLARRAVRHKTRKVSYRITAGVIAAAHMAVWMWLIAWACGLVWPGR